MKTIPMLSFFFNYLLCIGQNSDTIVAIKDQTVIASPREKKDIMSEINRNLKWPAHWLGEGTVHVKFTVDTLGIVRNPIILKGIDSIADAEVLRAVNMLPQQPKTFSEGKAVNVYYTIPIKFKIR
jgi:periplasmic protein TonB